jgi:hypothetical protein
MKPYTIEFCCLDCQFIQLIYFDILLSYLFDDFYHLDQHLLNLCFNFSYWFGFFDRILGVLSVSAFDYKDSTE